MGRRNLMGSKDYVQEVGRRDYVRLVGGIMYKRLVGCSVTLQQLAVARSCQSIELLISAVYLVCRMQFLLYANYIGFSA